MNDRFRAESYLGLGPGGFHRIAYTEWGERESPRVAVCVHGLTRQGRDFDRLAARLATQGYRVVCPDVAGRGLSERLADSKNYGAPQYLADLTALIARLGVARIDWIGTSMGGLLGLMLAAQANTPIERLVLNDIGPFIPQAALARIAGYLGADPLFADMAAAERYIRDVHAGFGPLSNDDWRHLTLHSVRAEAGGLRLRYDPAIAGPFRAAADADAQLWPLWTRVHAPVLVLRGAISDVLTAETARSMAAGGPDGTGPQARLIEFAGVGHAPALMDKDQIEPVARWLAGEAL